MKGILLFFLIFGSILLNAQNFQKEFSEIQNKSRFSVILNAGKIDKYIYVIESVKNETISLLIYDSKDLKLLKSTNIKEKKCKTSDCIDKHFDYERTLFLKDKLVVLFSSLEKNTKTYTLFAQVIDKYGKFEGKLQVIDKIQAESRKNTGSFRIWTSKDSCSFAVIQNAPDESSFSEKQKEEYGCKIFDLNLKNTKKFSISFPYKDEKVAFIGTILSNDGTLFFLNKVYKEKHEKERGQARYFYEIVSYNSNTSKSTTFKVDLKNRNIGNMGLSINKENDKLYCFGTYSDLKKREYYGDDIDGMFSMIVDSKSQQVLSNDVAPFTKELVASLKIKSGFKGVKQKKNADKKVKEDDGVSNNFDMRDLIINNDGSAKAMLEYYSIVAHTSCDSKGNCRTTYTYHYNEVLYIYLDKDGKLSQPKLLMKYQTSGNDGGPFSSFMTFENNDDTYLLYNDNVENLNLSGRAELVKVMGNMRKASFVSIEVGKDSFGQRKEITNNKETKYLMRPKYALEITDGEYIVPFDVSSGLPCACACITIFTKKKAGIMKISLK